jgi:hypothetical protein
LADTIRAGNDPHCYTAAMFRGMSLADFMALERMEDEIESDGVKQKKRGYWYKKYRQYAKPVNFGVPGGLGVPSLVSYARNNYRVEMSFDQAKEKRRQLITTIYPELNETDGYLADESMAILAHNLKVRLEECWKLLDWKGTRDRAIVKSVQKIVRGSAVKVDGTPYKDHFVRGVWRALQNINRNGDPRLLELLEARRGGKELYKLLFRQDVVTLTGRVRGDVEFTQARNTPFQSLAADGAMLALWNLLYHGFRVVGFVHDELLVELPDQGGYVDLQLCEQVKRHVCEPMAQVTLTVPIDAEYTLSTCWSKNARLLRDDSKVYPWQPEDKTG